MDKLNTLGGTEVMHHRAAARPEMGGEGEKAGRGKEADLGGSRWQVAEKEDRGHPSPQASPRTGLRTDAQLQADKVESGGSGGTRGRQALGLTSWPSRAGEGGPTPKPGGLGALQGKGAWKLATQAAHLTQKLWTSCHL